jgi:hypothetical protein
MNAHAHGVKLTEMLVSMAVAFTEAQKAPKYSQADTCLLAPAIDETTLLEPILDLNHRHWSASKGGLTAIGTWLKTEDDRWRPCMVIVRTVDDGHADAIPCVVTMDKAYLWSEAKGVGNPRAVAQIVVNFLYALRLDPFDAKNHVRVITLVTDHLQDLLTIPPRPHELFVEDMLRREPVAAMRITDQFGGQREVEV